MRRIPLITYLLRQKIVSSEEEGEALVHSRRVVVDGRIILNPKSLVLPNAPVRLEPSEQPVSRARGKLESALDIFGIYLKDLVCVDLGSSTGGFTELLLERGARTVYAVDTAKGELAWKLRQDPRVVVWEGVNALKIEEFPEPVAFVSIDISLVSLTEILPRIIRLLPKECVIVALVKPQYEVFPEQVPAGGVIFDAYLQRAACHKVLTSLEGLGATLRGVMRSPVKGRGGNQEFLIVLGV